MRFSRWGTLLMAITLSLFGLTAAYSQTPCDNFDQYSTDSVTTTPTVGLPGTTINVPLLFKHASPMAAFQVYCEYDANVINPIVISVDTLIDTAIVSITIDTTIVGTDTTIDTTILTSVDTAITENYDFIVLDSVFNDDSVDVRLVEETDYPGTGGRKRMKFIAVPKNLLGTPINAIQPGRHEVALIRFDVSPTASVGGNTIISFYRETVYNDSIPPQQIGCIFSQYYDSTAFPTHRLQEESGIVSIEEPPNVPVINSFVAFPDTIAVGESATLAWDVSNAATISISPTVGTVVDSIGSVQVSPVSTTTYTLTATNADGSVVATAKVTVVQAPPNNKPVFNSPTQTFWSIEQGQTLAFTVNVTDADNDNLTLTATGLPFNATFGPSNPVVGVGSVTGNFSFTPDFTQLGQFDVTFTASDGKVGGTQTLVVTIEVTEIEFDRLFTTSAEGQQPRGGLPGTRTILIPINLVTSQEVYGVQFDFTYDDQWFVIDSIITTPRTPNWVIYENIGQMPGEVRIVTFGVGNEPVLSDTNTAILYVVMSIDSTAPPGNYPILIENGWESTNPDPDFPSLPLETDGGIIQVDYLGDVNLDQRVDVADAVNVVGFILGSFGLNSRQFAAADVVPDSTVNVLDLVAIINIIFGIPPAPVSGLFVSNEVAKVSLDYPDMQPGGRDMLVVRSELPEQIAGVQLELRYDPSTINLGQPSPGADASYMVLSSRDNENGKLTVLLYFKNPYRAHEFIQPGQAELVRVPINTSAELNQGDETRLRLNDAMLSTPQAQAVRVEGISPELPESFLLRQNYPNPFNPTTTIEFSLGAAEDGSLTQRVTLEIYNILGQSVKTLVDGTLPPGDYQVDWDATNRGGQRVASGIYLYRLQVGEKSKSKKMMLLK